MTTPNLGFPEISEAQSSPRVTHNEALALADVIVHPVVTSLSLTAPPGSPVNGVMYHIDDGATPTGAWAGQAGKFAYYANGWLFSTPRLRMVVWSVAGAKYVEWDGVDTWEDHATGGGTTTFTGLTDTPANYTADAGKFLRVNSGETAVEFDTAAVADLSDTPANFTGAGSQFLRVNSGATAVEYADADFTDLDDTPSSFSGQGSKFVAVNSGATALEFVNAPSGGGGSSGRDWSLSPPVVGDIKTFRRAAGAETISEVNVGVVGSSTPTATFNIFYASARNAGSPTQVFTANKQTTSVTGESITTFDNSGISDNDWVWAEITALSGTVDEFFFEIVV